MFPSLMLRAWWADRKGAAAIEFVMVLAFLLIPIVNVIDFGMYVFEGMELHSAADAAAQAAQQTCGWQSQLPATTACAGLQTAENNAAQSTSLGTGVTITNGAGSEGYYCISSSGTLKPVGTFPTDYPGNCGSVGSANDTPGDYLEVTASFTYVPLITGVSLVAAFSSTMNLQQVVWMRLR